MENAKLIQAISSIHLNEVAELLKTGKPFDSSIYYESLDDVLKAEFQGSGLQRKGITCFFDGDYYPETAEFFGGVVYNRGPILKYHSADEYALLKHTQGNERDRVKGRTQRKGREHQ